MPSEAPNEERTKADAPVGLPVMSNPTVKAATPEGLTRSRGFCLQLFANAVSACTIAVNEKFADLPDPIAAMIAENRSKIVFLKYQSTPGSWVWRSAFIHAIRFCATSDHVEPQWYLETTDLERGTRVYALADILEIIN